MAKKAASAKPTRSAPADKKISARSPLSADWRIVLLIGDDIFLQQDATRRLREALAARHGDVDVFSFDGAAAQPAPVLDECRSFGLLAGHKLVIVNDAEQLVKEDARPLFERYAAAPADGSTLLLRANSFIEGKLGEAIRAVGAVLSCEPPTDQEAFAWITTDGAARHAVSLDRAAATILLERVGPDLARLDSEMGKLAAAAGESKAITPDLVREFVGLSRDEEIWAIQSRLVAGKPTDRLRELRYIFDVSRTPPQLVLYALTDLSRKIHAACRAAKAGANEFHIAKALRLWGDSRDAILGAARTTDPARALAVFRACVDADRRSKSGLGNAERAAEISVLRLPRWRRD
ncbi:MAG: DNA polymerase III subunit delta [Phycisphaeraceae bacterium]|nr:DNA polymerase III subunit delta [Phycisphaeraceae bacterium]